MNDATSEGLDGHPRGSTQQTRAALSPETWVDEHGDYLFSFAYSRVHDRSRAQDFVQDTLLAALRSGNTYTGSSSERTWLTGILRHKLLDHFRTLGREQNFTDLAFYRTEEAETFNNWEFPGHWTAESAPGDWKKAGISLDQTVFWTTFHECAGKLPSRVAQVFLLREVDEMKSEDICEALGISTSNLWVMLHRARLALRRCLETNWLPKS